ncbi:hypothetical protein TNIN_345051 [Trichonephila inaurata madagascariensis]|uniref:Uncharacterized protein n=1 Tax=Trichonephila inaurata madagascariensis TaxID=2747483 RepID=A0A8X6YFT6_9ARAC|nr:hypothetical protein TNIN_345051 [Trichonephila inaurata madagascariensis]
MASDFCTVCKMRPLLTFRPYYKSAIAEAIARRQALDPPLLQECIREPHHPMSGRNCKGGGYPIDCCVCRFDSCS